jgi:hypothetical protein
MRRAKSEVFVASEKALALNNMQLLQIRKLSHLVRRCSNGAPK